MQITSFLVVLFDQVKEYKIFLYPCELAYIIFYDYKNSNFGMLRRIEIERVSLFEGNQLD